MKIVNIDAQQSLTRKVTNLEIPYFLCQVIKHLEHENCINQHFQIEYPIRERQTQGLSLPLFPIRCFEHEGIENIATLIHTIPIYLRDARPERIDENSIVDQLGAYYPNRVADNPYIELFLSNIDAATNGNDLHFKWLFTVVLLHELVHAALDIFNCERHRNKTEKIPCYTTFGKWREESMANACALTIIKKSGDKRFYNYAKVFMKNQSPEYALGVKMEGVKYWDVRNVIDGKIADVHSTLQQEWLHYVTGKPNTKGLAQWNEILSSQYVYVYKDKYYTDAKNLVEEIVKTFIREFKIKNKKRLTIAQFKSIFPYIRTGAEMSYEPTDNVQDDSRYKTCIQLQDGKLSLYYFWDNKTLHEFVAKAGISFVEYKNY